MTLTRNDLTKVELKKYPTYKVLLQNHVIKTEEDALALILNPQKTIYRAMIFGAILCSIMFLSLITFTGVMLGIFNLVFWPSFAICGAVVYYTLRHRRFVINSVPRIVKVYVNEEVGGLT